MEFVLFWNFTQLGFIVLPTFRENLPTFRDNLPGPIFKGKRCVKAQKIEDLIYTEAETWNDSCEVFYPLINAKKTSEFWNGWWCEEEFSKRSVRGGILQSFNGSIVFLELLLLSVLFNDAAN